MHTFLLMSLACFGSVACVSFRYLDTEETEEHDESLIIDTFGIGIMKPYSGGFAEDANIYSKVPRQKQRNLSGTKCKIGSILPHADNCNKCTCVDGTLKNLACTNGLCDQCRSTVRKNGVCNIMTTTPFLKECMECKCIDGRASTMECKQTDCAWNYTFLMPDNQHRQPEGYFGGKTKYKCTIFTTLEHPDGCRLCKCVNGRIPLSPCNDNNCKIKRKRTRNENCNVFTTYKQYAGCNECLCVDGNFRNMLCKKRECNLQPKGCKAVFTTQQDPDDKCTRCLCSDDVQQNVCLKNACKKPRGKECHVLTSQVTPDGCTRCVCFDGELSCAEKLGCAPKLPIKRLNTTAYNRDT